MPCLQGRQLGKLSSLPSGCPGHHVHKIPSRPQNPITSTKSHVPTLTSRDSADTKWQSLAPVPTCEPLAGAGWGLTQVLGWQGVVAVVWGMSDPRCTGHHPRKTCSWAPKPKQAVLTPALSLCWVLGLSQVSTQPFMSETRGGGDPWGGDAPSPAELTPCV